LLKSLPYICRTSNVEMYEVWSFGSLESIM
jgi:hypothetical protein